MSSEWKLVDDPRDRVIVDLAAGRADRHPTLDGELVEVAYRHGLLGMIDPSLTSDPSATRAAQIRSEARRQVMERHLRSLLEAFDEAGVPATVLKGPVLGRTVYPDPRRRPYTDLDILVPRESLGRALELLRRIPQVAGVPPKGPKADKRDVLVRDVSGMQFSIDLHWDLFSYRQLDGCAADATGKAWAEARLDARHPLGPVWWLPDEAVWAFLSLHSLLDHRFRLILFRDLAEWARRGVDWESVVRYTHTHGLASFAYVAGQIASKAVDAPIPAAVLGELRRPSLALRTLERLLPRADLVRFDGRARHPINLAILLLHDHPHQRARLVTRAPTAFLGWRRRVAGAPGTGRPTALVLVTSDRRRGAEVFGDQLATGLRERGWAAHLLALSTTGGGYARIPARTLAVGSPSGLRMALVFAVARAAAEAGADVVLANGGATLRYMVAALAWRWRRPALVYSSIGEPAYWLRGRLHRRLQRWLLGRCDLVLAVSEATRAQLIDELGLAPPKVKVVHTGVPKSWLGVEADRPHEADELRLVFVGSLSIEKDPMVALEAVDLARRRVPVRLRFVGDGPLHGRLAEEVERRGMDGMVELTGSVAEVPPHLEWADALVLTSRTEGLPGVVLEAAAAGLPVIASAVGGVSEAVIDGRTGLVVPAGDPEATAAAIVALASDPERRRLMGRAGRRHVESGFLLSYSVARYHDALLRTVEGRRR